MRDTNAETQAFILGTGGRMKMDEGRHEDAERSFSLAVTFGDALPREMIGELWSMRGLNQAKWGAKLEQAGNSSAAKPHLDLAVQYVSEALTLDPGNRELLNLYDMVQAAAMLGTPDQEVSEVETRAFEKEELARMHAQKGQHEEAEKYLAESLALAEKIPQAAVRDQMMADLCGMRADNQARWGTQVEQAGNIAAARTHYELAVNYCAKGLEYSPGNPRLMQLSRIVRRL